MWHSISLQGTCIVLFPRWESSAFDLPLGLTGKSWRFGAVILSDGRVLPGMWVPKERVELVLSVPNRCPCLGSQLGPWYPFGSRHLGNTDMGFVSGNHTLYQLHSSTGDKYAWHWKSEQVHGGSMLSIASLLHGSHSEADSSSEPHGTNHSRIKGFVSGQVKNVWS